MSRLITSFLLLFLNNGAGNELSTLQIFGTRKPGAPYVDVGAPDVKVQQPVGQTPQARGAWLARQVEDRETGKDGRLTLRMRLYDRQQRLRERALTMALLKGGAGHATPGDRTLLRFTYPNDIKGTALLVWEHPSADDERFLYLPALGRVRRIAGSEAQESFVGSDFTYEDIGGREFESFSYTLVDRPGAVWKDAAGAAHPVYVLESRRLDTSSRFPRIVSMVRADNFVVVQADIHNRRDEVQKVFEARRVERVDGYWTVLDMVMTDRQQQTRTELAIEKAEYDVGLTPDAFSRRELERGGS
jgi:hypothetical protein